MRVSLIGHTYVADINHEKIEALAEIPGLELQVIVPRRWTEPEIRRVLRLKRQSHPRYQIVPLPSPIQKGGTLFMLEPFGLWRALRRFKPDLIHMEQVPFTLIASEVAVLAKVLGIPLMFFTWENLNRRYPPPFSFMNTFVLNSSEYAIAGNRDAEVVLREKGFKGASSVLPQLGVDPHRFSPGADGGVRKRYDLEGKFVVGFVGRLVRDKGVDDLIDAFARVSGDDWRLLVVGTGPAEDDLKAQIARLGLGQRTVWPGPVTHEEVVAFMRALDVFVLPSITVPRWKEQFGHVLIEAMGCEVPVVGSNSGEIPNVIGTAGMVFPEGDDVALGNALLELYRDSVLRRRLGKAGRDRVLKKYTHEAIALGTVKIYESVLGRPVNGQTRNDLGRP